LSIVVLPFANLSNDPEQEFFVDGITDDLTTDLSRLSGSFVIARNTAFTYKGKPVDAKQIGRELGVHYILEGSVRRIGDEVRVNVQLIDGENNAHLWADRFDTDWANLAAAQDEITGRLARALKVELVADVGRRIDRERAADPDARDLVMRGRALLLKAGSVAAWQEAVAAFERALEIDPRSVDARIGHTATQGGCEADLRIDRTRIDLKCAFEGGHSLLPSCNGARFQKQRTPAHDEIASIGINRVVPIDPPTDIRY
jgi:TolB-like protein